MHLVREYPITIFITLVVVLISTIVLFVKHILKRRQSAPKASEAPPELVPRSVNFHISRVCNYSCGFCFHTAKTSYMTPIEDAKRGLEKLAAAGMQKLNFAGGEPFLYPKYMGELMKFAKVHLKLQSVSIVSNGSVIRENFFKTYGQYLDILAISCDSFDEEVNMEIGRGSGNHVEKLYQIRDWCIQYTSSSRSTPWCAATTGTKT